MQEGRAILPQLPWVSHFPASWWTSLIYLLPQFIPKESGHHILPLTPPYPAAISSTTKLTAMASSLILRAGEVVGSTTTSLKYVSWRDLPACSSDYGPWLPSTNSPGQNKETNYVVPREMPFSQSKTTTKLRRSATASKESTTTDKAKTKKATAPKPANNDSQQKATNQSKDKEATTLKPLRSTSRKVQDEHASEDTLTEEPRPSAFARIKTQAVKTPESSSGAGSRVRKLGTQGAVQDKSFKVDSTTTRTGKDIRDFFATRYKKEQDETDKEEHDETGLKRKENNHRHTEGPPTKKKKS
ncbi:hypothetical protein PV11_03697 [Exophiala sideris]|uniref:Uncharacterized protein n=1 Tax=Exophiala sideris TaxID=1016849 RepID=A0A0D1YKK1_9EURO|nr:hypothetical protein PV11_03697 [Exophiala sideris]